MEINKDTSIRIIVIIYLKSYSRLSWLWIYQMMLLYGPCLHSFIFFFLLFSFNRVTNHIKKIRETIFEQVESKLLKYTKKNDAVWSYVWSKIMTTKKNENNKRHINQD